RCPQHEVFHRVGRPLHRPHSPVPVNTMYALQSIFGNIAGCDRLTARACNENADWASPLTNRTTEVLDEGSALYHRSWRSTRIVSVRHGTGSSRRARRFHRTM